MSEIVVTEEGIHIRYRGAISVEEIERRIDEILAHPLFDPALPSLWDLTEAEMAGPLGVQDMRRIGLAAVRLREGADRRPRVAVASGRDAIFGDARMFGGVNEAQLPADFRVFRCPVEAEAWAFGEDEGVSGQGDEGGAAGVNGDGSEDS